MAPTLPPATLVLASNSPYRSELLARLGLPFTCCPPGVDEAPRAGESPRELAARLSLAKARAVADGAPDAVVIGSDQVATDGEHVIGKPGSLEAARRVLATCSGTRLSFLTGVAVVHRAGDYEAVEVVPTEVWFRVLDAGAIAAYVGREPAPDCAGGFKVEGLGITLFERVSSDDPTALVGLPLIALARLLRGAGVDPLAPSAGGR